MYDKAIPAEVKELQAAMRKASDVVEQRRMQVKLSRLQQSLKQHEDRSLELEVRPDWNHSGTTALPGVALLITLCSLETLVDTCEKFVSKMPIRRLAFPG